ncbi:hypothetical protein [Arthrobacter sp. ZGTC131]|uniref:hypothetical protein n=1 Tax=Arthrobacter sp. ZGTC131 TaxID=2058898 RepID=UPI000CE344CA|nr:hypothetical protein [Arthrobacter sp. ZGTC131]
MTRRGAAAVGMGLVLAYSTALPAAATDGLLFSADGQTWDGGLSQPLFGRPTLVPGDQVSGTFWVRNGSRDRADLSVSVIGSDPAPVTAGQDLWISATSEPAPSQQTGADGAVVLRVPRMEATESRKVTITVGLNKDATNALQGQSRAVAFQVRMSHSVIPGASVGPGDPKALPDNPDQAGLAYTGLAGFWPVIPALAMIAGGTLAVLRVRANKKATEENHGTP